MKTRSTTQPRARAGGGGGENKATHTDTHAGTNKEWSKTNNNTSRRKAEAGGMCAYTGEEEALIKKEKKRKTEKTRNMQLVHAVTHGKWEHSKQCTQFKETTNKRQRDGLHLIKHTGL